MFTPSPGLPPPRLPYPFFSSCLLLCLTLFYPLHCLSNRLSSLCPLDALPLRHALCPYSLLHKHSPHRHYSCFYPCLCSMPPFSTPPSLYLWPLLFTLCPILLSPSCPLPLLPCPIPLLLRRPRPTCCTVWLFGGGSGGGSPRARLAMTGSMNPPSVPPPQALSRFPFT